MADQSPLIVPLLVEALVVNDSVRTGSEPFLRSEMHYSALARFGSAEPLPLDTDGSFQTNLMIQPANVTASAYYNGIYVKWRLPDALTRGSQDNVTGITTYPKVPNRWLVLRSGGSVKPQPLTAWIVESDYVHPPKETPSSLAQAGSLYLAAGAAGAPPQAIQIGRNVALATQVWTEPNSSLGLTAMAPGNPAFAAYQPANNNVFSFIDSLDAYVDPATGSPPTSPVMFSYSVYGWYSDPAEDPLHGIDPTKFAETLSTLGWALPDGTDATLTTQSVLLAGFVTGVEWQTQNPPAGGPPQGPVTVAVGDTSAQALTALVQQQSGGDPAIHPELFEAFQLDLIRMLDQPDGPALLAERLRLSTFKALDGGYGWEIVDDPSAKSVDTGATEIAAEAEWLGELNRNQSALDDARRQLAAAQRDLYASWWKYTVFDHSLAAPPPSGWKDKLAAQLDPTTAGTAASTVAGLMATVTNLEGLVPHGDTQKALEAAIETCAAKHNLAAAGRLLKRFSRTRFYQPADPVLLITGAGAANIAGRKDSATVRFPSQLVGGVTVGQTEVTAATAGLALPALDLANLKGAPWPAALFAQLAAETFFRDPGNADTIAAEVAALAGQSAAVKAALADPAAAIGVAPIGTGAAWAGNPWKPLMLAWTAQYYPLPYQSSDQLGWTFQGDHYAWTGQPVTADAGLPLGGRAILTPQATANLQARMQALLDVTPDMREDERDNITALLKAVSDSDHFDLLSQAMSGFNALIASQAPGVFVSPAIDNVPPPAVVGGQAAPALSTLIGDAGAHPPAVGMFPARHAPASSHFQPWRAGQFILQDVAVIDEWGQAIRPIQDHNYQQALVARPPEMTPARLALPAGVGAFSELEPGLLQPARLNFDLISPTDKTQLAMLVPGVNPICGWVLPNHLDRSLSIYDPDGGALGELVTALQPPVPPGPGGVAPPQADVRIVAWVPGPGDTQFPTLASLSALPHLGAFVQQLAATGPDQFDRFLAAIDETLWTTAPTGAQFDSSLAVLFGRPLALVRARLKLELDGPALTDPAWLNTFAPATPALPGYDFAIGLGNDAKLDEGLIGYFRDEDGYARFNIVPGANATADSYLKPVGADGNWISLRFDGESEQFLSMLVDPRAPVHAISAVLPDQILSVPQKLVDAALGAMEIFFRTGPVFTETRQPATDGTPGAPVLVMPLPKLQRGTWSWTEKNGDAWTDYAVAPADAKAKLADSPPVLRRGYLKLSGDAE